MTHLYPIFWSGMTRSFLMKSCAKGTPIGYTKSQHAPSGHTARSSTDIPHLWGKAQNLCQKWIQGARNTQTTKNKNCCKMLQNVARCCKPLYLGTLKSRNTSSKQKFTPATLQARAYLARRVTPCYRCINPPAGARVEMARAKKATLLQITPCWNQQTLTSVVNGVVPWRETRLFFNRSSGSIESESFERSPPPPPPPIPTLHWHAADRPEYGRPRTLAHGLISHDRYVCQAGTEGRSAEFAKYLAVPSYLSNSPPRSGTQPRYRLAYCG